MKVNNEDDFLYRKIIDFLGEVKLVQGVSAIYPTIRRHKFQKYLIAKQKDIAEKIEERYFLDGELNQLSIEEYHHYKTRNNSGQII